MKLYGLSRVSDNLIEGFSTQGEPPTEFGATGERAVPKGITSGLKSDGLAVHTEFFSLA